MLDAEEKIFFIGKTESPTISFAKYIAFKCSLGMTKAIQLQQPEGQKKYCNTINA
jgi:hypothetical protein